MDRSLRVSALLITAAALVTSFYFLRNNVLTGRSLLAENLVTRNSLHGSLEVVGQQVKSEIITSADESLQIGFGSGIVLGGAAIFVSTLLFKQKSVKSIKTIYVDEIFPEEIEEFRRFRIEQHSCRKDR